MTIQFKPPTKPPMRSPNHGIMPRVFSCPAIITSAENHTSVSHAPFSLLTSSHVSTPESSSTPRPMKPVAVASRSMLDPAIHSTRMRMNTTIIFFSGRVMGPISASLPLAMPDASGVSLISGALRR